MLTDFQKEIIQKVKDHWNLVPKTESNITRWQLMPAKVALIVELFHQSKLSAEEFSKETGLTPGLISKFAKGKLPNGKKWIELEPLLNPEKVKKEKENSPEEIEKKEVLLKKEILTILNRDKVKDIGLRAETIVAELSSYVPRFVMTTLNRLVKEGKIESFKSEDKQYKKFRYKKSSDSNFRKEWKEQVVKLLEETGLGKDRGLAPREIRELVKLDDIALSRELLNELVLDGKIISYGMTKGLKYVSRKLQEEAALVYWKEIDKKEEAKDLNRRRFNIDDIETQTFDSEKEIEEKTISQEILPIIEKTVTEQNLKEEPKFSLDDFLAEKSKKDILDTINSLSSMTFGDLIETLKTKNAHMLVDAFFRLSLNDLQNHKS